MMEELRLVANNLLFYILAAKAMGAGRGSETTAYPCQQGAFEEKLARRAYLLELILSSKHSFRMQVSPSYL